MLVHFKIISQSYGHLWGFANGYLQIGKVKSSCFLQKSIMGCKYLQYLQTPCRFKWLPASKSYLLQQNAHLINNEKTIVNWMIILASNIWISIPCIGSWFFIVFNNKKLGKSTLQKSWFLTCKSQVPRFKKAFAFLCLKSHFEASSIMPQPRNNPIT